MAALIALVGVFLAGRALMRSLPRGERRNPTTAQNTGPNEARAILSSLHCEVTVDAANAEQVGDMARTRVGEMLEEMSGNPALGPTRREDLGQVFRQSLMKTVAPDLERDLAAMAARGVPVPFETPTEQYRENWEAQTDMYRFVPIGLEQAEIRVIKAGGRLVLDQQSDFEAGFNVWQAYKSGADGEPMFKQGNRDIVEVRLPMQLPTTDGPPATVLMGYMYAWDDASGNWVPYLNAVYGNSGERIKSVPLPWW